MSSIDLTVAELESLNKMILECDALLDKLLLVWRNSPVDNGFIISPNFFQGNTIIRVVDHWTNLHYRQAPFTEYEGPDEFFPSLVHQFYHRTRRDITEWSTDRKTRHSPLFFRGKKFLKSLAKLSRYIKSLQDKYTPACPANSSTI